MEPHHSTSRLVVDAVVAGRVRVSAHALREAEEDSLTLGDILITVYLPDAQRWSEDFRRRRARDAGDAQ